MATQARPFTVNVDTRAAQNRAATVNVDTLRAQFGPESGARTVNVDTEDEDSGPEDWLDPAPETVNVDTTGLGTVNVDTSDPNENPSGGPRFDFVPTTQDEWKRCLLDPMWRICSGQLYKIMVKSAKIAAATLKANGYGEQEGGEGATVVPFRPNRSQRRFIARLWHRNIILKARQLGFTTLVCILWLDHALFNENQRCGIIAQDRETAESVFRDKVKVAYDNLPAPFLAAFPLKRDSASELWFAHNNSSIRVATSMRAGTTHRLLVSEFGKIGAADPAKATEVVTGSLPSVPQDGVAIIESTAEGQEGEFYKMTMRAMAQAQAGVELTEKDFRFNFFPWWQEPGYRIKSTAVPISDKDREYFQNIERETGARLDQEQRNWYVATRDAEYSGDPEKMWQEYPSTAKEAFQVSTEGVYYAQQLADMRKEGRLTTVPHVEGVPVNTFWDIGSTDGCAVWFHQRVGLQNRFIKFIEGWNEPYAHYIEQMQGMGYVWGTHYLPHDAEHIRQGAHANKSPKEMLEEFDIGGSWECVPRVDRVTDGIQATRAVFNQCWFDIEGTKAGIAHLGNYRKTWNKQRGGWNASVPSKVEGHSEAADALRQFGQGYDAPQRQISAPRRSNWRTA